eukprot:TRINITY_DN31531_c0_g1_i1.p1 TRINITY_DN31531_c0_g1~~TRINITY_DN31531_c0_g1_i1.p1  ORF type:complete len:301 (+),score=36.44 TRINITY_DN31531_c0_g1_i1:100-1002(+)
MAGMTIFLDKAGGGQAAVDMRPEATVGDLAEAAAGALGVSEQSVTLYFQGSALADPRLELSDAGVGPEARVEVHERLSHWNGMRGLSTVTLMHSEFSTVVELMENSIGWWRVMETCPNDPEKQLRGMILWGGRLPSGVQTQAMRDFGSVIHTLRRATAGGSREHTADLLLSGGERSSFGNWIGCTAPWGFTWANEDNCNQAILLMPDGVRWYNLAGGVEIVRGGPFRVLTEEETEQLKRRVRETHPTLWPSTPAAGGAASGGRGRGGYAGGGRGQAAAASAATAGGSSSAVPSCTPDSST